MQKICQTSLYVIAHFWTHWTEYECFIQAWCVNHFACSSCDQKMTVKTKFYEVSKRRLTWWDKMKKAFRTNISKQCRETRAERWKKKLKIWNTISTYEQFWCLLCNRSIWSRSARSATTATQGRWDSGSKSERNIMYFFSRIIHSKSMTICRYHEAEATRDQRAGSV